MAGFGLERVSSPNWSLDLGFGFVSQRTRFSRVNVAD